MSAAELKEIKEEVKQMIDSADDRMIRIVWAMLDADQHEDEHTEWWHNMPENVRAEVQASINEADMGQTFTHEEVKKMHPEWFTK